MNASDDRPVLSEKRMTGLACAASSAVLMAVGVALLPGDGFYGQQIVLLRMTGWIAFLFFMTSFACSPGLRVLNKLGASRGTQNRLFHLRRAAGIASTAWGLLHGFCVFAVYEGLTIRAALAIPHLSAGTLALMILCLLWLTSYPRFHPTLWKEWHALAYAAAALMAGHLLLSPWAPTFWVLACLGSLIGLVILRIPTGKRI